MLMAGASGDVLSVIISTYNNPAWLELVMLGYAQQTDRQFELIIADDGSGAETRQLVDRLRPLFAHPVVHVWQRDDGFRKCRILNKAILAARGQYLVFSDGDCIPRQDFLAVHRRLRRPGYFLSGGYVKLSQQVSSAIGVAQVQSGQFAQRNWLMQQGLGRLENLSKLASGPRMGQVLNRLSRTRAGWHGHNASCWESDALAVGGFDERMGWGGEDREFGYRLVNAGCKPRRIRYSAICVHLHHERPWRDAAVLAANDALRAYSLHHKVTYTRHGIDLLVAHAAASAA